MTTVRGNSHTRIYEQKCTGMRTKKNRDYYDEVQWRQRLNPTEYDVSQLACMLNKERWRLQLIFVDKKSYP